MAAPSRQRDVTSSDWPNWLKPYVQDFVRQYSSLVGQTPQNMPQELNQQVAGFTPSQQAGLTGVENIAGGQAGDYAKVLGQIEDTAAGKFLTPDSNSYIKQAYEAAARGVTDEYSTVTAPALAAEASRAGAFGSSGYDQQRDIQQFGLGQNLSDLAANMYGANYAQERQNMMTAQSEVPGALQAEFNPSQALLAAGGQEQQQQQTQLDTNFQNAMRNWQFPYQVLDMAGQAYNTALGPASQSVSISQARPGGIGATLGLK